jgi:hypothetical protein
MKAGDMVVVSNKSQLTHSLKDRPTLDAVNIEGIISV